MNFSAVTTLLGLVLLAAAIATFRLLPRHRHLWKIIPRERNLGIVIGFVSLVWSAYHTYFLLDGGLAKLRNLLPPVVILVTVLSYFLLDYLFSRSFGGFLLLLVNWLLHEAFVAQAPFRPVFSFVCFIFGIFGIFLIATPYRFRDLLRRVTESTIWRHGASLFLCLSGTIFIIISWS